MDEACGPKWSDEDRRKQQRKEYEEKRDNEIRKELEAEAKRKAKFDHWGRFQKKEKRIPKKITQADIDEARRKEPWRWY